MKQELSDSLEIIINTSSDNFVKVVSENVTDEIILFFPKHLFKGKIDSNSFELFRLKKFSWFDYNITKFKGAIHSGGKSTRLEVVFTMLWLYKSMIPITILILGLIDYFLTTSADLTLKQIVIFLFIELLAFAPYWFQYRFKLKTDKEKYIEILKSLFEVVEVNINRSQH